jgi:hypothetical protein
MPTLDPPRSAPGCGVAVGACVLCTLAGHYANRYSIINIIIFKKMCVIGLVNVAQVYLKKE